MCTIHGMASKGNERQADSRAFMSLALEPDEGERYREILRRARQRDPEASKSEIIRSLFRFPESDPRLVTKEDRDYFFQRIPVIKQSVDTPVPCMWCERSSKGGVCEQCLKELTSTPKMTAEKLNDLPYGAILLNEDGTVLAYNKAEEEMSRVSHRTVLRKNFFTDVAPCAEVKEFHGRFDDFLLSNSDAVQFNFTYKFKRGRTTQVSIIFVRLDARRALVISKKLETKQNAA